MIKELYQRKTAFDKALRIITASSQGGVPVGARGQ